MKNPLLKAEQLHKKFYNPEQIDLLRGVSLEITAGESIAIVGKSGVGKSTLLHMLGTLEQPCSGTLSIFGEAVTLQRAPMIRNKHIGFIFQAFNLLDEYTLLENLLMPARIGRRLNEEIKERARLLLKEIGLETRQETLAKQLSGGEKQRAAIARALLNDPDLILADEPTGNLDQANSEKVHELLLNGCKKSNKALIIVTHDRELATLCDRTLLLQEGTLWNC